MAANLRNVSEGTITMLRWQNEVTPNANAALADYLAAYLEDIEAAVLLQADHGTRYGVVGPGEAEAGRSNLGFRKVAAFDTLYVYLPTAVLATRVRTELWDLFFSHGIHGFIGQAMRFREVADAVEQKWGARPSSTEAVFARWGYAAPCDQARFSE